jgi:hypothetical protein
MELSPAGHVPEDDARRFSDSRRPVRSSTTRSPGAAPAPLPAVGHHLWIELQPALQLFTSSVLTISPWP